MRDGVGVGGKRKRKIDCPCVYIQRLRRNDTSVAMNMPSLHILVSVCHFPLKKKQKRTLGDRADSRPGPK